MSAIHEEAYSHVDLMGVLRQEQAEAVARAERAAILVATDPCRAKGVST